MAGLFHCRKGQHPTHLGGQVSLGKLSGSYILRSTYIYQKKNGLFLFFSKGFYKGAMPLGCYIPVYRPDVISILVGPHIVKLQPGALKHRPEISLHVAVNGFAYADLIVAKFLEELIHAAVKIDICAYFAGVIRFSIPAIVMSVVLCACGSKEQQPPLSEAEMVRILLEMYLSDEKISRASLPYDSVAQLSPLIRNRVLSRLGVSDSAYLQAMEYYMNHPDRLDKIYGVLIDSLSLREQRNSVVKPDYDTPAGF